MDDISIRIIIWGILILSISMMAFVYIIIYLNK